MTEPSPSRPVPGPPRPGPAAPVQPSPAPAPSASREPAAPDGGAGSPEGRFADLEQRPVAEHVATFEDEHARLQHELSTIDQL